MVRIVAVAVLSGAMAGAVVTAEAQPAQRPPRIGVLFPEPASPTDPNVIAFRQGLRDLGYVEGHTILIEHRSADGKSARAP